MPALRTILVATLLLIVSVLSLTGSRISRTPQTNLSLSPTPSQSSEVVSALNWLTAHEGSDGSYGLYLEGQTAAAAYALWLNDSESRYAASSYSYLAEQLKDPTNFLWFESDIPGEVLFSLAITGHLGLIQNTPDVSSRLLNLQQVDGGFEGYYNLTTMHTVTSSVDTAMALLGLMNAQAMPNENRTAAVNYLLTLQNPDGSFNLTHNGAADPIYSLGPDTISITALVVLVLRDNGFSSASVVIQKSLGFLTKVALAGFNGQGHVYAAALSTLTFLQCYRPHEAAAALAYLATQQNGHDGSFRDVSRSSGSNALDTGWAAVALQYGIIEGITTGGPVNRPPTAKFSFTPEEPTNGIAVSFDAGSSLDSDGDSLSYAWTFGDGGSASGQVVTHVYTTSGDYTATLTVTDSGVNPAALVNTAWLDVTVQQSKAPARAAPSPSTLTSSAMIILALLAVAIVTVYLVVRSSKRKLVPKITVASPRAGAVFEAQLGVFQRPL